MVEGVVMVESDKAEEGKNCWFIVSCPGCSGGSIPVVLCNSSIELPSLKEAKFVKVWGILTIKGEEPLCPGVGIEEGKIYLKFKGIRVII